MEINSQVIDTPPRPAASVVLLRDAPGGLEVFLIKRHGLSDVLAGAFVFPGGKVDRHDRPGEGQTLLHGSTENLVAGLNEPAIDLETAVSLYVAAIRETFEESGVLLACGAENLQASRASALARGGLQFDEVLASLALRLDTRELLPLSRWITPRVPTVTNKRFDTRFFVAPLPAGQSAQHDNHEATDSVWLRPRDALQQYWDSQINFAPPQIMTLAHLSHYGTVRAVQASLHGRMPSLIEPEPFDIDGGRVICYPGDERHSNPLRAMPGPTRLIFRNRRFEPPGGFEALFLPPATA